MPALPCGSLILPTGVPTDSVGRIVRTPLMLNCVRFGSIAGQERAVVAAQNGLLYLFAVPQWTTAQQIPVRFARTQAVTLQRINVRSICCGDARPLPPPTFGVLERL